MNEHLAEINVKIKEIPEQHVNTDVTEGAKKGAAAVKEAITKAIDTTTTLTAVPNVGRSNNLEVVSCSFLMLALLLGLSGC